MRKVGFQGEDRYGVIIVQSLDSLMSCFLAKIVTLPVADRKDYLSDCNTILIPAAVPLQVPGTSSHEIKLLTRQG